MEKVQIHAAKSFRSKQELNRLDGSKPGYYKWLIKKIELERLLEKLGVSFSSIERYLETIKGQYCIYVGIAVKESIKDRLNWHINQKHSDSNIKHGTLSTLRQSISSLLFNNQKEESGTNDFIDQLSIEIHFSDKAIKSKDAMEEISKKEKELLSKDGYLYILNIKDNRHLNSLGKILESRRATAKQQALLNKNHE